jgi:hypothetical protein
VSDKYLIKGTILGGAGKSIISHERYNEYTSDDAAGELIGMLVKRATEQGVDLARCTIMVSFVERVNHNR